MSRLLPILLCLSLYSMAGCVSISQRGYQIDAIDLTGGMSVIYNRDFGGQNDIRLAGGMASDAWIAPTNVKVGIPFLLQFHIDQAPYHLRIELFDESLQYQSIEIREVLLDYADGTSIRKTVNWKYSLRHSTQHHSSGSVRIETETLELTEYLDGIIDRHQDVKITLKGCMMNIQGEPTPFSTPVEFKARTSFMITPTWMILMGA